MASSVNYYQKQKDLQEIMHASEQKRKQLEAQLQAYCQSDQKFAQLRAVKLQSYWRRVCEDEKRSRQRNAQLLRDLDNIETNMTAIAARTHRLGQLKEQYFAYIDRTYPQWVELMQKKKQEQQLQQQQRVVQEQQQQQKQQQAIIQQQQQQQQQVLQEEQHQRMLQEERDQRQRALEQQQQQRIIQEQKQKQQQQFQQQQQQQRREEEQKLQIEKQQQQQKIHQVHQRSLESQQQQYEESKQQSQDEDDDTPPPLPSSPPPPITALHSNSYGESYEVVPEREYANIQDVYRVPQGGTPVQQGIPSVTVRMPDVGEGRRPDSGQRSEQHGWLAAERDVSVHSVSLSESVEVGISQPVQSVTVRQRKPVLTDPPIPLPNTGPMAPTSDDDISDFGDDIDLPSGSGSTPHTKPGMTRDPAHRRAPSPEFATGSKGSPDGRDDEDQRSPQPDLSMTGVLHLLTYLDDNIDEALVLEGYYRSRNPDTPLRKDIIHKANSGGTMHGLDGPLVSMVLLEQLTPVVRRLPGACLLSDTLLVQGIDRIGEADVRSYLHRDMLPLWHKLLEHFLCLVRNRVMGSREVAYVFVPCLVHDSSHHQDKGVRLLEKLIEDQLGEGEPVETARDSVTQDTTTRSSQAPGVPALKFGSLLDSKPFSDDESSMITQSMNTDGGKLPANETEAYKHLVSGTAVHIRPPPVSNGDDTDNNSDNDDLEHHFASTLSPRSPAGTMKSGLGSTASSHQKKLGKMISSDLDTDTELEIHTASKKDDHDDDDFYDFYG